MKDIIPKIYNKRRQLYLNSLPEKEKELSKTRGYHVGSSKGKKYVIPVDTEGKVDNSFKGFTVGQKEVPSNIIQWSAQKSEKHPEIKMPSKLGKDITQQIATQIYKNILEGPKNLHAIINDDGSITHFHGDKDNTNIQAAYDSSGHFAGFYDKDHSDIVKKISKELNLPILKKSRLDEPFKERIQKSLLAHGGVSYKFKDQQTQKVNEYSKFIKKIGANHNNTNWNTFIEAKRTGITPERMAYIKYVENPNDAKYDKIPEQIKSNIAKAISKGHSIEEIRHHIFDEDLAEKTLDKFLSERPDLAKHAKVSRLNTPKKVFEFIENTKQKQDLTENKDLEPIKPNPEDVLNFKTETPKEIELPTEEKESDLDKLLESLESPEKENPTKQDLTKENEMSPQEKLSEINEKLRNIYGLDENDSEEIKELKDLIKHALEDPNNKDQIRERVSKISDTSKKNSITQFIKLLGKSNILDDNIF